MKIVWENSNTKGSERLVLLALADQANDDGYCWPSFETIAKRANISRRFVIKIMNNLQEKGLIERKRRNSNGLFTSSLYRVVVNYSSLPSEQEFTTSSEQEFTRVVNGSSLKPSINHQFKPPINQDGAGEIFKSFENNIQIITKESMDKLNLLIDEYPDDWILEAIDISVQNNKRSLAYMTGILKRWQAEGKGARKEKQSEKPVVQNPDGSMYV